MHASIKLRCLTFSQSFDTTAALADRGACNCVAADSATPAPSTARLDNASNSECSAAARHLHPCALCLAFAAAFCGPGTKHDGSLGSYNRCARLPTTQSLNGSKILAGHIHTATGQCAGTLRINAVPCFCYARKTRKPGLSTQSCSQKLLPTAVVACTTRTSSCRLFNTELTLHTHIVQLRSNIHLVRERVGCAEHRSAGSCFGKD